MADFKDQLNEILREAQISHNRVRKAADQKAREEKLHEELKREQELKKLKYDVELAAGPFVQGVKNDIYSKVETLAKEYAEMPYQPKPEDYSGDIVLNNNGGYIDLVYDQICERTNIVTSSDSQRLFAETIRTLLKSDGANVNIYGTIISFIFKFDF